MPRAGAGAAPGAPGSRRISPVREVLPHIPCVATGARRCLTHLLLDIQHGALLLSAVCKRLGCTPGTLRLLYGAGVLVPATDDTGTADVRHQYAEEDIVAFLEQYSTSDVAAEVLGVTRLTVQGWARAGRIPALTGPEIDGSHTYRFEKAALIQWRSERLTFGEAMALLGVSKATLDRWVRQGRLTPLADMGGKQRWFGREEVERMWSKRSGIIS